LKLEKIFFLYGTGANGKSVIFEILSGLIGEDDISHYSLESLTDSNGYHRAKIKDKIVNYGTDVRISKINPGLFKTLASNEPIDARLPYGQPFIMSDYARLIFNTNRIDDANIEHTNGFYRRILIVPFSQTIPEEKQDKELHKKLLKNKAGILNWIIEGARSVIRNKDIFVSAECQTLKDKFIKETDNVAMFVDSERLVPEDNKNTLSWLYGLYTKFCDNDGYKALGKKNFSKRLEALQFLKTRNENNDTCFRIIQMSNNFMDSSRF